MNSKSLYFLLIIGPIIFLFGFTHFCVYEITLQVPSVESYKVGLITDKGGINDRSFNSLAYQGLMRAQNELGVVSTYYESGSPEDYTPNLRLCVEAKNDLCVSVGQFMKDATLAAAEAYPGTKFAIVDVYYDAYPANLRGLVFGVEQPAYLAGVFSGLMSQTKVIGVVGGMEIPQVAAFTEPYRNGVLCASPGATVILSYADTFNDPNLGAYTAQKMITEGGDVIFAPAGSTGLGAVRSATQSGAWGIGVDTDYYSNYFDNGTAPGAAKLLTSVQKKTDLAVYLTIKDLISDTFMSGTVHYDMANGGTGLAPFHAADALISPIIKAQLERVKNDLLAGRIDVNSSNCGK